MVELAAGGDHARVTTVHTEDTEFKGRMRRCSGDEPQFEVVSDETGESAMHRSEALEKLG